MNRKLTVIGMGVVLLASIIVALVLVLPGTAKEAQPASLPPPPLDTWVTYADERFGFSFTYPPDWHLNVVPDDAAGGGVQISTHDLQQPPFKGPIPPGYLKIEFMVVGGDPRNPGESLTDWRHRRADWEPSKVSEEKQEQVAGVDALEEKIAVAPGYVITTIYFPYSHKDYGETGFFISATPFGEASLEEVFRQILSTFKFEG